MDTFLRNTTPWVNDTYLETNINIMDKMQGWLRLPEFILKFTWARYDLLILDFDRNYNLTFFICEFECIWKKIENDLEVSLLVTPNILHEVHIFWKLNQSHKLEFL